MGHAGRRFEIRGEGGACCDVAWFASWRDVLEHFGEQFKRQANDVGFASRDNLDPGDPVLVSERASFSLPGAAVEIRVQFVVRQLLHDQVSHGDLCLRVIAGSLPEAEAAEDPVFAAAYCLEHLSCVGFVAWFAEHLSLAFSHGVTADHDALINV